jgi:hypothetical protein
MIVMRILDDENISNETLRLRQSSSIDNFCGKFPIILFKVGSTVPWYSKKYVDKTDARTGNTGTLGFAILKPLLEFVVHKARKRFATEHTHRFRSEGPIVVG